MFRCYCVIYFGLFFLVDRVWMVFLFRFGGREFDLILVMKLVEYLWLSCLWILWLGVLLWVMFLMVLVVMGGLFVD